LQANNTIYGTFICLSSGQEGSGKVTVSYFKKEYLKLPLKFQISFCWYSSALSYQFYASLFLKQIVCLNKSPVFILQRFYCLPGSRKLKGIHQLRVSHLPQES